MPRAIIGCNHSIHSVTKTVPLLNDSARSKYWEIVERIENVRHIESRHSIGFEKRAERKISQWELGYLKKTSIHGRKGTLDSLGPAKCCQDRGQIERTTNPRGSVEEINLFELKTPIRQIL